MYNYLDRSNNTFLIIVSITTLYIRCYGTIANISKLNWANAHMHCREEGKMLPNLLIHTLSNERFLWTGHYTRLSGWIKIIGCYEETVVNLWTKKSHEMYFPSAGRCQEVCLASNYSVFGVQLNTCVCLEQIPGQRRRGSNDCSSSCPGNYSAETNIKFQNYCGGHQTYNVFKSGSDIENSAFTTNECLAIQCATNDKIFKDYECATRNAQICNETRYEVFIVWQSSSAECKSEHNSYLFGDIDLTDPSKACSSIQGMVPSPSWIGIAKEKYISIDGVKDVQIERKPPITYPIKCLKCNSDNCTFADCKESNYFECLERPRRNTYTAQTGPATITTPNGTVYTSTTPTGTTTSITPHGAVSASTTTTTTISTTLHGTFSASTTPMGTTTITTPHGTVSIDHSTITIIEATEGSTRSTNKKKESMMKNQADNTTVIMVVVPVTVVLIFGLIALLVIFWRRRQTKKTAETKHAQHQPNLPNHSEKSDTNHSFQNNYFVLKKTEKYSVVYSMNHANDKGCRILHNECYDDDYDHFGENLRVEEEKEDTYHHAFFPSNEDESDYGIKNISDECQMENPYSQTNTGAYHVVLADNEYNTISINA